MAQRVGRGIVLLFLDRDTRRGWVVSSTPRPHFTPGKDPVPICRRLGGPQGRSGRAGNLVPTEIRSRTVQPVVSRYTDWATRPTVLLLLSYNFFFVKDLFKYKIQYIKYANFTTKMCRDCVSMCRYTILYTPRVRTCRTSLMKLRASNTVVTQNKLIYNRCNSKEYYSHCHLVVILHYWRAVPRQKQHTVQRLLPKILCVPKLKPRYCGSKRSLIDVFTLSLMCNVRRYMLAIPASRAKHHKTNWALKNGELGYPETSVNRCQHASCNIWGERRPELQWTKAWNICKMLLRIVK